MNAGLPGTGLGGLFYILGALWMPFHALYDQMRGRRTTSWRVIMRQAGIAAGVLGALWLTGWALGYAISLSPAGGAGGASAEPAAVRSVIRWAGVVSTALVLAFVMSVVHALRIAVVRPRRRVPLFP